MTGMNFTLPRTCVVDDTLDVQQRLKELTHWREDYRRQDAVLTEQIDQASAHEDDIIAFQRLCSLYAVRQRLHAGWLQQPFEYTSETVASSTYDGLYQHLADQFVGLSDDERMCWLDNLTCIITPDTRNLMHKVQHLITAHAEGNPGKLLVYGSSGTGKTHQIDWLTANGDLSLLRVDAPLLRKSIRPLFYRLLTACNMHYKPRAHTTTLIRQIQEAFARQGVQAIAVDEMPFIASPRLQQQFLELIDGLSVSLIGISCNAMDWIDWIDSVEFSPYAGEYVQQMFLFLDLILPFRERSLSNLISIHNLARGRGHTFRYGRTETGIQLRYIVYLVYEASKRAIRQGERQLSMQLLKEVWQGLCCAPYDIRAIPATQTL